MTVPNWQHNSNKQKKGKGTCKGKLKARKQSLNHFKNSHKTSPKKGGFSVYKYF